MNPRFASALALGLLTPLAGCNETLISVSTDGRIEVGVNTSGLDTDSDGFSISVDGATLQFVAAGGTVTVTNLSEGSHSVQLSGLADNCRVEGPNPRPVLVGSDGVAQVTFQVRCSRATTGGFLVNVTTTGNPVDPDGYQLNVAGSGTRQIAVNASETFLGLTPGTHLITLKDVDPPCTVVGGNPQPFTVVAGKTVAVGLTVACGTTD
ncbi:MAG TPA: hypothetical protein VFJ81_08740 [Gemmatimonadales bacterium]|nr:hypothetical protein [Gemmatimonadales bacterium]